MLTELTPRSGPAGASRRPSPLEALILRAARRLLDWEPQGAVVVELPGGTRLRFGRGGDPQEPVLKLRNLRVLRAALRSGAIGFAESYIDRDIDCSDLPALFRFFLRNREELARSGRRLFRVRALDRLAHRLRRNSRAGSRRNITEHYDLGNAFFRAWLDGEMVYSSAIYPDAGTTLEEAQREKLGRIVALLDLPEDRAADVLEIGSGWGALACMTAAAGETRVTGLTLSHEQLAFAREKAAAAGLAARCDFRLEDYRDTGGQYDRIVSIEMIEAVGEAYWPQYFRVLGERLRQGGSAVIQAITIDEAHFERYRRSADFIQRHVFPGGMLPTPRIIREQGARAGLTLDHVECFGASYARTLADWRHRFEEAWPRIAELGFDDGFRRRWRYYLAYCEAGFQDGLIDVGLYRLRKSAA
ncbi:class I SAM-dependent methyltransferase [Paroceanicella profunda]|uniref:Class I SAM-dependent methyltransferase n=1 Tax=Paroceanicella profunda TaxID=2579971 RepID=A0A5B8FYM2_9RHOB|nr:cyclopropane-fatty-acyl-phospholipid synthase family protein [Paroceanicella profunda]QDL91662.1 class I SAM-dependent methyltransferase [Paroceanicella profunda]